MLHILNGDATLALIEQSPVEGDFVVWKDMLMEGPVSLKAGSPIKMGGLDWNARAAYLNREYGIDSKKYLTAMKACIAALEKAAKGKEEVVFWFEEDFFCQIHLVFLLANLPEPLKRKGRATIICPEKPLGVRLATAFPKLLAGRIPADPSLISLATRVWKAYSASSTKGWGAFLEWAKSGKGFEAWPLLKSGLRSHLGRLPSANGKLNALDTALLRSVSNGNTTFSQFVRHVWNEPMVRPLGLGDLQVARYALNLAQSEKPLLAIDGPGSVPVPGKPIAFSEWKLHLTAEGKDRLAEMIAERPASGAAKETAKKSQNKPTAGKAAKLAVKKAANKSMKKTQKKTAPKKAVLSPKK